MNKEKSLTGTGINFVIIGSDLGAIILKVSSGLCQSTRHCK